MNMGSSFFFQDVIFIWTLASKTTLLVGEDKKNIIYQGYFFLTKSQKIFYEGVNFFMGIIFSRKFIIASLFLRRFLPIKYYCTGEQDK